MKPGFKNVLVTGGCGFIGSHLAEAMVREGTNVTIVDNLSTGRLRNMGGFRDSVRFVEGDIRDGDLVRRLAENCDAIFHLAAVVSVPVSMADPILTAQVNEIGTLQVLDAARRRGVPRVVMSSSCAVYGNDPRLPKTETMPADPASPYAVSKLHGEGYARLYHTLYGVETVALRYFNVYGPRQDASSPYSGVISLFLSHAMARRGPEIHGDGLQYRDFIYVEDVVRANLAAARASGAPGNVINIGTGHFVTIRDVWKAVEQVSGFTASPVHTPARPGDIAKSVADTHRADEALNFAFCVSFERGIEKTWQWFCETRKDPAASFSQGVETPHSILRNDERSK